MCALFLPLVCSPIYLQKVGFHRLTSMRTDCSAPHIVYQLGGSPFIHMRLFVDILPASFELIGQQSFSTCPLVLTPPPPPTPWPHVPSNQPHPTPSNAPIRLDPNSLPFSPAQHSPPSPACCHGAVISICHGIGLSLHQAWMLRCCIMHIVAPCVLFHHAEMLHHAFRLPDQAHLKHCVCRHR